MSAPQALDVAGAHGRRRDRVHRHLSQPAGWKTARLETARCLSIPPTFPLASPAKLRHAALAVRKGLLPDLMESLMAQTDAPVGGCTG